MNKLLIVSSTIAISFGLASCHTMNDTANFTNATVGNGVKYTATTVGKGVGFVSNTGAAVGKGVGTVVGSGVGLVTGHPHSYHKTVYHHGHHYMLQNGRYVRVN